MSALILAAVGTVAAAAERFVVEKSALSAAAQVVSAAGRLAAAGSALA